jgi:hypothetical protein
MGIKHIIHLSDIHIRCGDSHASRYDEYTRQIDNTLTTLSKYDFDSTIIVVTGDLFHDKSKIGPCGQLLAQRLFSGLSKVASETLVIRGNHDYRQDQPNEPDLIKPFFIDAPNNVSYLDETGLYQYNDIEFGIVAVQDTLVKGAGSGVINNLPDFPVPTKDDPSIKHSIALFHGTFGGALLQNGTEAESRSNYPLDWIQGYDIRMFGDIHVPQIQNAKIQPGTDFTTRTKQCAYVVGNYKFDKNTVWAYAGSLVQQNFGESLWGHGFIEWNLEDKTARLFHVPNDFGFVITTLNTNDEPCVKIRLGRSTQLIPVSTIVTYAWFPETISLRFSTKARNSTIDIQAAFEEAGIVVKDTGFVEENSVEETEVIISSADSKDTLVNDLSNLNSPQTWIKYFTDDAKIDDGEWSQWILHPHLLSVPIKILPQEVVTRLEKRNTDFAKQVDTYIHSRDERGPVRRFRIHFIEYAWLLCFGKDNYLNFEGFGRQVNLINGNNGSGKSSLLEIICLAIFGESFPSRYNKNFSAAVINQHKPDGESAYTKICFSIDGKKYWITRSFETQQTNIKSLWQRTVRLVDHDSGEIIKQTNTSVSPWITSHIGKYEHFLLTTIVSQSNDSDFFAMKTEDQKAIIDSLLQLNVCELFCKILEQANLDHKYCLTSLATYESGRKEATRFTSFVSNEEIDAMTQRKAVAETEVLALKNEREACKEFYSSIPEKTFQTPLYEYEADKKRLEIETFEKPDGDITEIKIQKQIIKDRLAVLRTKKYKTVNDTPVDSFDNCERKLLEHKAERLSRGPNIKIYDSKAHALWLQTKDEWFKTHNVVATKLTLNELQNQYNEAKENLDAIEGIDEDEHKPVSDKVLQGLRKQHDTLLLQVQECEQNQKHLRKELVALKSLLTSGVRDSIVSYKSALDTLTKTFNSSPEVAQETLRTVNDIQINNAHKEKEISKLRTELSDLIKIQFNPSCKACNDNPYRQRREYIEQQIAQGEQELVSSQKKIKKLLNSNLSYDEMKTIYDTWSSLNTNKIISLMDSLEKEERLLEEDKVLSDKIADLNDEIDENDYENQEAINEYFRLSTQCVQLENLINNVKFSQQEKEWALALEVSELDNSIKTLEYQTTVAYTYEYKHAENELNKAEILSAKCDSYTQAVQTYQYICTICEAYPKWKQVQNIDNKLRPLTDEIATLSVSLVQASKMNSAMNEAKTFEQQIVLYRELLETRNNMIKKLSDAYNQYTAWLYPKKVGPAIENAVNEVLNSIALPRPITLRGEWDKDHFSWFMCDGNSTPPYEKCSGAQRFFIGLAVRIALGRLGSSNIINEQLFQDEGFTACDAETMERVPGLLRNLLKDSNKLNSIFIVSHMEQLKVSATASISIIRGATSSRLTVGERTAMPKAIPLMVQDAVSVPIKKRGRPKKSESNDKTIEVVDN